ncbi:lysylphosphatidylglycerol synthase domain-containing protein [Erythrobacter dokdonensis]|uniref:Putative membrane protein n=1 Tax=Erythrobacter dokdonensis DSW-74 TaxID=1300349 RepID=A0A1A7BI70_9SPHN|nr:lysylphosphatidylglycerol synthase domain-containing protein [Erythrobacter dokdonensis]OBV11142.1 putative membrane protein [Erythrobacter dokdonensis DSW-74]
MSDTAGNRWKQAGAAVSVAAICFFAFEFFSGINWSEAAPIIREQGRMLPLALSLYLLAFLPMAAGWHFALVLCGSDASWTSSARIFLISQFAKYLPGNIGHLVGRVVLARNEGIAMATASAAMLIEIVGVLIAAGALVLAALALGAAPAVDTPLLLVASLGVAMVCGGGATFILRGKLASIRLRPRIAAGLLGLFILVFLCICAAQMVLLFSFDATMPDAKATMIVGSAIMVSWIAGFLTPGAPAGIGVREVSLLMLLQTLLEQEHILLAVAGMRLVTLVGDALMWVGGLCLPAQTRISPPVSS